LFKNYHLDLTAQAVEMLQIKVKQMEERLFQKSFLTFVVVKYKQEQFHCSWTPFILIF
jgi:hypothetical protein